MRACFFCTVETSRISGKNTKFICFFCINFRQNTALRESFLHRTPHGSARSGEQTRSHGAYCRGVGGPGVAVMILALAVVIGFKREVARKMRGSLSMRRRDRHPASRPLDSAAVLRNDRLEDA